MKETYEEIGKKEDVTKEISIIKTIFSWIGGHLKFLLIPGYVDENLAQRVVEYEKTKSKRKFISRFKSVLTLIGIGIIFVIVSFAIFAPWISMYSEEFCLSYLGNCPPGEDFCWPVAFSPMGTPGYPEYGPPWYQGNPLGTTEYGRDILGRMIWGARTSLTIALPAILFAVSFGIFFGVIAAYFGGWIDSIIMRIMDIFLSFPALILVLVFIAIWGRQLQYFILAYGVLGIAGYSRLIRSSVLQTMQLPYVEAAKVAGAGNFRIMFRHVLPNAIQPILIAFTFDIGGIILGLAGLSFLGFTNEGEIIEWGMDVALARGNFHRAPWALFWPGFMILITVLGFMLLGDGLRDALDPRLKNL
ncbi:MAG: ABC transporter permease [Candidatus Odinarchaeota archaeon]